MKNNFITKIIGATLAFAMMIGGAVGLNAAKEAKEVNAETTYEQLTSIASIDETAQYVLGVDGTGFHYDGTSSWGKTALPTAQTPYYYTLKKAANNVSFTAETTIGGTKYYLQIPTSNTFSMATSTGTNTDIIIGTTQVSGTNYAVTNKDTTNRHLRINGASGLRSYAGTTGTMAFFYKVVEDEEQQDAVTAVNLNHTVLNLDLYDSPTGSLTASIVKTGTPSTALTATSDNTSVATISTANPTVGTPFTVTAEGEGVAHIVVTSVFDNTKTASCTVNVTDSTPEPFVPKQYALCTSTSDLEVGARYIFTNGIENTVKTMSTTSSDNNRPQTEVSVNSTTHRITSTEETLVVELGTGSEENTWTFKTINYLGTNGFFASAASGSSNHLKVQKDAGNATITFNGNAAGVVIGPHASRNIVRYNSGSNLFACYSTGQQAVYLWKEYKELTSLNVTGTPTKLTGYYEGEEFDPTGITAYEAVYSDSSTKALTASDIKWPDLVANMGTIKGSYKEFGTTVYTPTYNISVAEDVVTTISLSGTIGTTYLASDAWDKGSIVVTAIRATGKQNIVTNDAVISYYRDSAMTEEVATPAALGNGQNQKVYVKATYQGVSNTTGYEQTVSVTVEHGSVSNDPLTVDEAIAMGAALPNNGSKTEREYYISGMVYSVTTDQLDQEGEEQYATFVYDDSDPGKHFQAYKIKPAAGCTGLNELRRGAAVVLKTKIYRFYSGVIENDDDGEIISISYNPVELNSILIKPGQLDLAIGDTYRLDPVPYPLNGEMNNTYWFVQDPSIVSVDANGVVKGLKEGFTRVFYFADGMSSDSCKVYVYSRATLNLSTDTTKSASEDAVSWEVPGKFTMDLAKGESQSNANAYYPGVNNYTSTRFYKDQVLTFTPDVTLSIAKVELEATSSNYATVLGLSQGLVNATASCDDTIVTIRPTDGTLPFSITPSGACGFTSVKVFYTSSTEFDDYMINSSSIATVTGDEDAEHNATNLGLVFGARIRQSDWNAIEKVFGEITDYGMMFVKRESLDEYPIKTIAGSFTQHSQMAVVHKGSGEAPQEDGSDYIFSARINITLASNYDTVFVGAPFIVAGGTYYFLPEIEYSLRSLAEYCFDHDGCGSNLSAEALFNVATM